MVAIKATELAAQYLRLSADVDELDRQLGEKLEAQRKIGRQLGRLKELPEQFIFNHEGTTYLFQLDGDRPRVDCISEIQDLESIPDFEDPEDDPEDDEPF